MKKSLHLILISLFFLLFSDAVIGQTPPDLGSVSSFAVFTAAGAFNVAGASTVVIGDVGTNVGAFNGFPPGTVIGTIHTADAVTAAAATDLDLAYQSLSETTCEQVISTTLGNGQILLPDVYCLGAASTINGDLILDGQSDPNSIFIFKIDGALATTVNSRILFTNGANQCNVYWQVNGQVDLGENSLFQGIILANGAINLLDAATLNGQALSKAGAISLSNNLVSIGVEPVASILTTNGSTTFCDGQSVEIAGNVRGVFNTGETTSSIIVTETGEYFVTNSTNCGSNESNHVFVTVNPLPICQITGDIVICEGQSTELCAIGNAISYLWSTGEIDQCIEVSSAGNYSVVVTNSFGCSSSCSISITGEPNNPPSIVLEGVITIECLEVVPDIYPTFFDADGDVLIITCTEEIILDTCGYSILRTCTATDPCGASVSAFILLNIVDTTPPAFIDVPAVISVPCEEWGPLHYPIAIDCDENVTVEILNIDALSGDCLHWSLITFIATDDCGNSATVEILVELLNLDNPIFVELPDGYLSVSCEDWGPEFYPIAIGNCGTVIIPELISFYGLSGNCSHWWLATFEATDDCGNSTSLEILVELLNLENPIFVEIPGYLTVACDEWGPEYYPIAIGNCGTTITPELISFNELSGGCSNWWLANFEATDDCENTTSLQLLVNLIDTVGPVILNVPDDLFIQCGDPIPAPPVDVYAVDICSSYIELTYSETSGDLLCDTSILRTWTATDLCGNTTIAQQIITIGLPNGNLIPSSCPCDINADGLVNIQDMLLFTSKFGCTDGPCGGADFNSDGDVNVIDMLLFVADYGTICN